MIAQVRKRTVKYNRRIVGYLAHLDDDSIAFQYDDEWIKNGFSISPFSLPLSGKIYQDGKGIFEGLYGVFHDSLPDGWGELLVKRMLAKQGINADKLSPLTKLTLISGSGLGGLTYEPTQIDETDETDFDLDFIAQEMNREANTILSKANDLEISNRAIELKTEIEKVREQIQNIE